MPRDAEMQRLADFFTVMGDSTRVQIIAALRISELCVSDLAGLLSLSDSAISHQLRILRQSNLVKSRRDGKFIYYSLADDHVVEIYDVGKDHINE
ncbi:MAG: metalloregulator ArsR/SmtB family transcription factor [Eubacteriales bacterium]|nr:metalloregulator ArsR/SmtB family transcription factor [Eubacteriales bacterium]